MNCVFVVKTRLLISKSKALARSYITRTRCPRLVLVCRALINVTKKGCVCKIQRNAIKVILHNWTVKHLKLLKMDV